MTEVASPFGWGGCGGVVVGAVAPVPCCSNWRCRWARRSRLASLKDGVPPAAYLGRVGGGTARGNAFSPDEERSRLELLVYM